MNREQARENLITIGIEEPTSEQITNYLNQLNGETKRYSDRAEKGKEDARLVEELQAKLDAIESQNMTDLERANKSTEDANKRVAELESEIRSMKIKNDLATKGIIGEQAEKLIEGLNGGVLDVEVLGQIIAERELASATAKEKEIADNSANPNGGSLANNGEEKTNAEKTAESLAKNFGGDSTTDIVSSYM